MSRPLAFPMAAAGEPPGDVLGFLRLLWAIDHGLQLRSKKMERELGVTGPQRLVLRVLRRYPHLTAGQLAAMLHVHASTLTGVLVRMKRRGLILRSIDKEDRRRCRLTLTALGRRIEGTRAGTVEADVAAALSGLTPLELAVAHRALARVGSQLLGAGELR